MAVMPMSVSKHQVGDLLLGLLVAVVTGAVNGAAVAAATGFDFDAPHLKAIAAASIVSGLLNASAFLHTPQLQPQPQHQPQAPPAPATEKP